MFGCVRPECWTWRSFSVLHATEQPVRQPNDLSTHALLPIPTLLYMFNSMAYNSSFLVEFEYEQSRKLLGIVLALATTEPLRNLVDIILCSNPFIENSYSL